jgi:hypothetical protein
VRTTPASAGVSSCGLKVVNVVHNPLHCWPVPFAAPSNAPCTVGKANSARSSQWQCPRCARLRFPSEGGALLVRSRGLIGRLFEDGRSERPDVWFPSVFSSPADRANAGLCTVAGYELIELTKEGHNAEGCASNEERLMLIYLDTMLWDILHDQKVAPDKLKKMLVSRHANIVPGPHVFYEMLRTFQSPDEQVLERGRKLLSFFGQFIGPDTPCTKDNMELLAAEIDGINRGPAAAEMFLSGSQRDEIRNGIDKLASGILDKRATRFLTNQKNFASRTRLGQKGHLQIRKDIKKELKSVSPQTLDGWLRKTVSAPAGIASLTSHLLRMFRDLPAAKAVEQAKLLLNVPAKRFARGVVRADLYYNWRCAMRDSVPKDLIDDMYHVLNAAYCDVYATAEKAQAEYAHLLLTSKTKVSVYTGSMAVDQWIESLV